MSKRKKYCMDIMERDSSGRLRLSSRGYLDMAEDDDREFLRIAKRKGMKAAVEKIKLAKDADKGEYLITLFREKRKRNGAIKSKKKIDGYRLTVE